MTETKENNHKIKIVEIRKYLRISSSLEFNTSRQRTL